jgi:hypothetical protein
MKMHLLNTLLGLAISFAAPALAQEGDTVDPKIVELIVAHQKIYDEAMNNNDAVALATKMFTDDAVLVTETGPIYGRTALRNISRICSRKFTSVIVAGMSAQKMPHDS